MKELSTQLGVDVSIVIPVKNGRRHLAEVLDAILAQRSPYRLELIAIDSGSTDGSLDLIRSRPVRLLTIPSSQFNHGLTRNLAIEKSSGRFIVLLTQDATPVGDSWLETIVRNLEDDTVAGAYGRQMPRPDADPITKHNLENWITGRADRRVNAMGSEEYQQLQPYDRYLRCYFDNVCSAIKRSIWERFPFPTTYFAEDCEWGKNVLLAGYRTVYEPQAAVLHSHDRTALYEYRRTYVCHRRLQELFELRTIPTRLSLFRAFISECRNHARILRDNGAGVFRLASIPAFALASTAGQYFGAAAEILHKPLPRWQV